MGGERSEMGETVPFTSNYTDVSTYDGYQFEFYCRRCGNGHRSAFRPAVTSFGGRIAELGGSLLGGELGSADPAGRHVRALRPQQHPWRHERPAVAGGGRRRRRTVPPVPRV